MVYTASLVLWIEVIFARNVVKGTIAKTVPITVAKQKIVLRVKEKRPNMRRAVLTLHFGLNQIAVVESADASFTERLVLEHI